MLALAVIATIAWVAVPDDPWVQLDRSVGASRLSPGPRITEASPRAVVVNVPRTGLGRIDVRFDVPRRARDESIDVLVREVAGGTVLQRLEFDLRDILDDRTSQIHLNTVTREEAKRVRVEFHGDGSGAAPALWEFEHEALPSAYVVDVHDGQPGIGDLDMATYSFVASKPERLGIVLERISILRGGALGAGVVGAGALLAALGFVGLVLLLCGRREDAVR